MERPVAQNSGMVVRAERGGVITYVDSSRILIDNADEYVLRKFVGLNERTCLNQKPIVKKGQRVKKGQIIADGAATHLGELALGRNVLVAFMTYDGYNFEDAIVISQRLVKDDMFTSIHIEEYDVEIRETKLGREEFTRDIPNVSERALANLDENGVVRVGTRVGPRRYSRRQDRPQEQERTDAGRKTSARDLRPRRRGREERFAGNARRRRRRRHQHPAVQPPDAHDRRPEEGAEEGHRQIRKGDEPAGRSRSSSRWSRRSTKSPASRWSTPAPARRSASRKTPTSSSSRSRASTPTGSRATRKPRSRASTRTAGSGRACRPC